MTKNIFHENLVRLIAKDKQFIQNLVQFNPDKILINKYFNNNKNENYEIDIYTLSNLGESSIFEIKSHNGLRSKFTNYQYPRFRKFHPKSQLWLIYPNIPYNLDINDLHCEFFENLKNKKIEYI